MGDTIRFKKGPKSELPILGIGEPGLTTDPDDQRLYVGGISDNIKIPNMQDLENINEQLSEMSNPNLLINGNFKTNQRKQYTYSVPSGVKQYTVDRWMESLGGTITLNNKGILYKRLIDTDKRSALCQRFEQDLDEGIYTLSFKMNGEFYSFTHHIGLYSSTLSDDDVLRFDIEKMTGYVTEKGIELSIKNTCNEVINIEWVKLERGSKATPFYHPRKSDELAICQKYSLFGELGGIGIIYLANEIYFLIPTPVTLISLPSLINSNNIKLYASNTNALQGGFTFSITNMTNNTITLKASKTSHGVTQAYVNIPSDSGLDSELY